MMRLYAVEYTSGAIKVGISTWATQRVQVHDKAEPIRRYIITGEVPGFTSEAKLVQRMARISSGRRGRETFYGCRLGQVATLMRQITGRRQKITRRRPHVPNRIDVGSVSIYAEGDSLCITHMDGDKPTRIPQAVLSAFFDKHLLRKMREEALQPEKKA